MHDSDDIGKRIIQYILKASDLDLKEDDVTLTSSLRDDLALASLEAINLVMELEDNFGIVVDDAEITALETVGDLVSAVEAKLALASERL